MDNPTNYDEMFRQSQQSSFSNPNHTRLTRGGDELLPPHGQREQTVGTGEALTPEVLDATGHPLRQTSRVPAETLGFVSLILGVVAFLLVFLGMFFHFVMWINILVCLTGVGFGVASLLKQSAGRVIGIIGIALCVFDLIVELICMLVVAISAGVSAIFHLFT